VSSKLKFPRCVVPIARRLPGTYLDVVGHGLWEAALAP